MNRSLGSPFLSKSKRCWIAFFCVSKPGTGPSGHNGFHKLQHDCLIIYQLFLLCLKTRRAWSIDSCVGTSMTHVSRRSFWPLKYLKTINLRIIMCALWLCTFEGYSIACDSNSPQQSTNITHRGSHLHRIPPRREGSAPSARRSMQWSAARPTAGVLCAPTRLRPSLGGNSGGVGWIRVFRSGRCSISHHWFTLNLLWVKKGTVAPNNLLDLISKRKKTVPKPVCVVFWSFSF